MKDFSFETLILWSSSKTEKTEKKKKKNRKEENTSPRRQKRKSNSSYVDLGKYKDFILHVLIFFSLSL